MTLRCVILLQRDWVLVRQRTDDFFKVNVEKLKVLFSSVSGKDLTIIGVSETGLTSSFQLYNARRRQSGTEYSFEI